MAWTMGGGMEETGDGDGPLMLGDGDDADDAEGKAAAGGQDGGVRTKLFGDADSADGGSRGSGAYSRSSGGSRRSAGGKSAGSGSAGEHDEVEDDGDVVVEEGVMDAKASRAAKAKADRDR